MLHGRTLCVCSNAHRARLRELHADSGDLCLSRLPNMAAIKVFRLAWRELQRVQVERALLAKDHSLGVRACFAIRRACSNLRCLSRLATAHASQRAQLTCDWLGSPKLPRCKNGAGFGVGLKANTQHWVLAACVDWRQLMTCKLVGLQQP